MLIAFAIYVTPLRTIKGVSNTYSYNTITDSPHNCFLGGGNEADANSTVAGIDCVFDGNTLDRCAYEAADAGAFYTCGQEGAAFVNRGNSIANTIFKNVRNTVGTGMSDAICRNSLILFLRG